MIEVVVETTQTEDVVELSLEQLGSVGGGSGVADIFG